MTTVSMEIKAEFKILCKDMDNLKATLQNKNIIRYHRTEKYKNPIKNSMEGLIIVSGKEDK